MIEIIKDGRTARRSRNLRGILAYAAAERTYVERVELTLLAEGKGQLTVTWADGARAVTEFADFAVCCDWLASRYSLWRVATLGLTGLDKQMHETTLEAERRHLPDYGRNVLTAQARG